MGMIRFELLTHIKWRPGLTYWALAKSLPKHPGGKIQTEIAALRERGHIMSMTSESGHQHYFITDKGRLWLEAETLIGKKSEP